LASAFLLAAAAIAVASCERTARPEPPLLDAARRAASAIPSARSLECGRCHAAELEAWRHSHHARANRLVEERIDRAAATGSARWRQGTIEFAGVSSVHRAEAVIGVEPLRQYLVPFPGGRWQPVEPAFDPARGEWFPVAVPPRRAEDWGHWANRGSNWNSQCAVCHMTGYEKGWDEGSDTYESTWEEMGVGCASCHGPMTEHARTGAPPTAAERVPAARATETCAPCHSRRETLTENFRPGDSFHDHFRLTLPDVRSFHPDGQARAESFEYNSFQMSRMAEAGVGCTDCHDPHSGRLRAPAEDNSLCLDCHGAPTKRGALPVDPVAHGHHPPGSAGNQCVACHMPSATFMARDKRRDHSFSAPDPRLANELGVPDACASCHGDRDAAWRIARAEEWYGPSEKRERSRRARTIAAARDTSASVVGALREAGARERNPMWRAALTALLSPWAARDDVASALTRATRDPHALVRAAALRALHEAGGERASAAAHALARDSARLVRVDAAWVLAHDGVTSSAAYEELVRYIALESDQPPGAMRRGQLLWLAGDRAGAERWLRRAATWDVRSATAMRFLGMFFREHGDSAAAESAFVESRARAARDEPTSFGGSMGGPHAGMPSPGPQGR
jgi:predicted CXXCH cytochrome family protein